MSTRVPARPLHRRRFDPRPWLALWCVLMLSATYVGGWAYWSYTHLNLRVVQRPPGEPGLTSKGSSFRVLSMLQSPVLARSADYGGEPITADEGMTFVAVTFEVTRAVDDELCLFNLAGADGRSYENSSKVYGRELRAYCSDFPVGEPTRGELAFEIPRSQVDRLIGIYDTSQRDWRTRHNALTPPR